MHVRIGVLLCRQIVFDFYFRGQSGRVLGAPSVQEANGGPWNRKENDNLQQQQNIVRLLLITICHKHLILL